MNRNPILIRNIKHLTDARYFAAMGVDWMSMALTTDPVSFAMWHTLKDWISGVKLAAEIDGGDDMVLAKAIIDANPDGIVTKQNISGAIPSSAQLFLEIDSLAGMIEDANVFYVMAYSPDLPKTFLSAEAQTGIFLVSDWTKQSLEELLAKGYTGGICFFGGEEEEVGMRDYELMDDLLEMLQ